MNFDVSTKVPRVSMTTESKTNAVLKDIGHRSCVAYSEEKRAFYNDGEWVASDLDASIMTLRDMYYRTKSLPLTLRITYMIIKI